jgi:predicted TIM-barrel fold metal-dependent hydrolase
VDPTQPGWQDELIGGHQNLKLKGIKLLPMYAGFDPNSRDLDYLWEYATKHGLPALLHTGTTFIDKAPLEYTRPYLLDNVAIRFPEAQKQKVDDQIAEVHRMLPARRIGGILKRWRSQSPQL